MMATCPPLVSFVNILTSYIHVIFVYADQAILNLLYKTISSKSTWENYLVALEAIVIRPGALFVSLV